MWKCSSDMCLIIIRKNLVFAVVYELLPFSNNASCASLNVNIGTIIVKTESVKEFA